MRDILQVAGAAVLALVASACSSPATDAIARTSALSASLPAVGASDALAPNPRTAATSKEALGGEASGRCPRNMAAIEGRFCIDRYEAGLVDILANGEEQAHSPFTPLLAQQRVRAVSAPSVYPQGYISAVEAQRACGVAGKRL